jgi:selenide,water dikinase
MQGPELNVGFVVNGVALAEDGRLLGKRGLAVGDRLVLAKPLGTGVLFAAHMRLAADGRDITAAIDSMLVSNRLAAELALAHGASACTDISGFGLLGHLLEMLGEAGAARLQLAQLPLLGGVLDHLRRGVRSSMHPANAAAAAQLERAAPVDENLLQVLYDPQTSGGLLIGVAADRAPGLLDALRRGGYPQANIIGEVLAAGPAPPGRVAVT